MSGVHADAVGEIDHRVSDTRELPSFLDAKGRPAVPLDESSNPSSPSSRTCNPAAEPPSGPSYDEDVARLGARTTRNALAPA